MNATGSTGEISTTGSTGLTGTNNTTDTLTTQPLTTQPLNTTGNSTTSTGSTTLSASTTGTTTALSTSTTNNSTTTSSSSTTNGSTTLSTSTTGSTSGNSATTLSTSDATTLSTTDSTTSEEEKMRMISIEIVGDPSTFRSATFVNFLCEETNLLNCSRLEVAAIRRGSVILDLDVLPYRGDISVNAAVILILAALRNKTVMAENGYSLIKSQEDQAIPGEDYLAAGTKSSKGGFPTYGSALIGVFGFIILAAVAAFIIMVLKRRRDKIHPPGEVEGKFGLFHNNLLDQFGEGEYIPENYRAKLITVEPNETPHIQIRTAEEITEANRVDNNQEEPEADSPKYTTGFLRPPVYHKASTLPPLPSNVVISLPPVILPTPRTKEETQDLFAKVRSSAVDDLVEDREVTPGFLYVAENVIKKNIEHLQSGGDRQVILLKECINSVVLLTLTIQSKSSMKSELKIQIHTILIKLLH